MQWHLEALARAGVRRVVVNTDWLGQQIVAEFDSVFVLQPPSDKREKLSKRELIEIQYSHEGHDFGSALETAGGIARALPLLCPADRLGFAGVNPKPESSGEVFWLLAGDVFAPDFLFSQSAVARFIASDQLAHLWLVPNPAHNPRGDFGFDRSAGLALNLPAEDPRPRYTYSTIGLYRKTLFETPYCAIPPGNPQGVKAPLAPLLRAAMNHRLVSAELYAGGWTDVGTPERLEQINAQSGKLAPATPQTAKIQSTR
jgi:MurNAc alpha-1-phosphate uridylyltransferase